MWTFDNFPAARVQQAYGWAPDQAWLDRIQAASARLENGCSAAIVSGAGLVQTNHHCIVDCVQNLSSEQNNLVLTGFRAMSREEEAQCPGLAVQLLTGISDVTQRIEAAAGGASAEAFTRARDGEIARIEQECRGEEAAKRCQVVTLYQGGQYKLYEYKRFDDVRLAFAPEIAAAFFGGDPDNFNFPRFCFDVAYIRLYENGAPAATPAHLQMRATPLSDGELVFVSGNPGATSRLLTQSQLTFERDYFLPWRLTTLAELRGRLSVYSDQGAEQARIASDTLFSVENTLKALAGRRLALVDPQSFAQVSRAESDLQTRVSRNRAAQREAGQPWNDVSEATAAYRGFFLAYQYLERRAGSGSELFNYARHIVRGAAEREKPNDERLTAYTDARLQTLESQLFAATPIEAPLEELLLSFWLEKTREYLTTDDPRVRQMLGRESPEELATRLARGTRIGDPAFRRQLWEGGAAAVSASDDPMIVFVRAWDDAARALRTRYEQEVEGPTERAQERIARARFRAFGETIYPDATFTLRLSYGRVAGWTEAGGENVGPFTRFSGLYDRATGADPYALAPSWSAAQPRLDPNTIFNVTTTNDIIGGNSGSPLLDREGRVVGAVFDGNIHSLGGEYFFDPRLNRTIAVAATAVQEALVDVYGMQSLASELRGDR
ncbi:MAG: S46 family peptidase [Alphaproteobacteria bacterium]|nr:S46 family peptidase [Alphaproteobacteria bacterium]